MLVISEVAHFLRRRVDVELRLLADLQTLFRIEPVADEDWERIAQLVEQYDDLPRGGLGTVDASVVTAAERLRIDEVATLDSHFGFVVPTHVPRFTILPSR
jgi:uncharacterized protein